jgi:glycosyltransferase involved in cell wall biosynthesis
VRQLTIGVPAFNAMPYLTECIQSALDQSYRDFDILVVNDGSSDKSAEYLDSIKDPRLRVVHQQNQGVIAARNRMLAEARTPWLALLDADDVATHDRVATVMTYIDRFPESGMFYSLANFYQSKRMGHLRTTKGNPAKISKMVRNGYLPDICNSTVVLNISAARAAGGFRKDLCAVEDIDLFWRLALKNEIRFIPQALARYRHNAASLSSSNLEEQELHLMYVQYLLLSHLTNRAPSRFEDARKVLQEIAGKRLGFKREKREFIIELGAQNISKAFSHAFKAFVFAPGRFCARCLDTFFPFREIRAGECPSVFTEFAPLLWPSQSESGCGTRQPSPKLKDQ